MTKPLHSLPIDLVRFPSFVKWLEAKSPRARVGTPNSAEDCVIGRYLYERTGVSWLVVPDWYISQETYPVAQIAPPEWMVAVCRLLDRRPPSEQHKPVTAEKVLRVLKELETVYPDWERISAQP